MRKSILMLALLATFVLVSSSFASAAYYHIGYDGPAHKTKYVYETPYQRTVYKEKVDYDEHTVIYKEEIKPSYAYNGHYMNYGYGYSHDYPVYNKVYNYWNYGNAYEYPRPYSYDYMGHSRPRYYGGYYPRY